SPFDPRIVARYEAALEHDPDDSLALRKLTELYRKYRTLDELANQWKNKKSWQGRAVYSDLLVGPLAKPDQALGVLEAAPPGRRPVDGPPGRLDKHLAPPNAARAAFERAIRDTHAKEGRKPLHRARANLAMADKDWDAERKAYDELIALEPQNV